ncbi:hypothetical protein BCR44DRAFT_127633 [Catenaria anguillulae PL171]|uniref:Ca3427-like PBP 2 domain-containing protein n=1 Tax=Catenaria anguillulae PL171 TaxID=765915 RepID=A0A1Y2HUY5_9FUNG|nr:hypothetical protein BCR44DRAFT_127633 [Catenaria anguillulae PL171]
MASSTASATTGLRRFVIGGVPEHFNVPIIRSIAAGAFRRHGLDVEFKVCHGGTGEQLRMLAAGELDGCVALTEGLVSGAYLQRLVANGPTSASYRLLGTYVKSPLTWAISTAPNSSLDASSLEGARIGISRFYSGSHLIPIFHALRKKWSTPYQFVECGNFANLRDSVVAGNSDAFLWEVATTRKWFDDGTLRFAGTVVPDWPAFSLAISCKQSDMGSALAEGVRSALSDWASLSDQDKISTVTHHMPSYAPKDVASWLEGVQFADHTEVAGVSGMDVATIVQMLSEAKVIEDSPEYPVKELCNPFTTVSD